MSSSFNLISHTDRTLAEHLSSCDIISKKLLGYKFIASSFFAKDELQELRRLLVYFHDFGKGTDFFQYRIIEAAEKEENDEFLQAHNDYIRDFKIHRYKKAGEKLRVNDHLGHHAKLGAYFLFSNFSHKNAIIEYIMLKVISRHHGNLTDFAESHNNKTPQIALTTYDEEVLDVQISHLNFDLYQKILEDNGYKISISQWEPIKSIFKSSRKVNNTKQQLYRESTYRYFFLQHYLFSLLLSADKGDMMIAKESDKNIYIKPNRCIPTDIISYYKSLSFKSDLKKPIDYYREVAYQDIQSNSVKLAKSNFFSITLPTGLGKTLSAYNAAITLQHQFYNQTEGFVPRIIYCLPFTSIIDQNSQIMAEIFDLFSRFKPGTVDVSWIAKNHYLSRYNERYDQQELINDEGEYLTEGWEQEVIITTFVQLLESILTNKNRALRKFHNMTNAIIVLDEVQNIPPKYYEAIETVFKQMAHYFNTKFLFVTATQPLLFENGDDVIELTDPLKVKTRGYFETLERIELDQSILVENNYEEMDIDELIEIFQTDIEDNPDKSFLIISNTIAHSQYIFNKLSALNNESTCFIYLSGSILPRRRKKLINVIKGNIRRKTRQIIVSTQVVEAGVDIDLDIVYRDLAPLDCINQSAGRCNRNGIKGKGTVKLFNSGKAKKIYDDVLLDITIKVLSSYPNSIDESSLYELNLAFAEGVRSKVSENSDASHTIKEAMQKLELETIASEFKLIKEENYAYNVYIPYNKHAVKIWNQYIDSFNIQDVFERKRVVKKIKPQLLQYVTRFPKSTYQPTQSLQSEAFIVDEPLWEDYYDLYRGFKINEKESTLAIT
jgi:CRISPR-associated endonuclease/helicase Cas3